MIHGTYLSSFILNTNYDNTLISKLIPLIGSVTGNVCRFKISNFIVSHYEDVTSSLTARI